MRRLLVPGASALVMLCILLGLGAWQVRRLEWKRDVLAQIFAAERSPPVPLPDHPPPFAKVSVMADAVPGTVGRYGVEVRDTPQGALIGSQMLAAVQPAAGGAPLLVLAGWVPDAVNVTTLPPPDGVLQGYLRTGSRPGWFTPADDLAQKKFFALDPPAIARALGLAAVRPSVLVLIGQARPGKYPQPAETLPRPPNDHLQYAITWFSLAGVLVVVFALYARRTLAA